MEPLTWALAGFGRSKTAPELLATIERAPLRTPHRGVVRRRLRPAADGDAERAAADRRDHLDARGAAASFMRYRALRREHAAVPTSPACPRSRCRCTGPPTGCRSERQLVAPFARGDLLLAVGAPELEQVNDWRTRAHRSTRERGTRAPRPGRISSSAMQARLANMRTTGRSACV